MSATRIETLRSVRDANKGLSASTQRDRLLCALRELDHVTTFEASRYLDLYDPRARKLELVRHGHDIMTVWRHITTESGDKHRVGVYMLVRGGSR